MAGCQDRLGVGEGEGRLLDGWDHQHVTGVQANLTSTQHHLTNLHNSRGTINYVLGCLPWDQSKSPDWRGGLISGVDEYHKVTSSYLVTLETSQRVRLEGCLISGVDNLLPSIPLRCRKVSLFTGL